MMLWVRANILPRGQEHSFLPRAKPGTAFCHEIVRPRSASTRQLFKINGLDIFRLGNFRAAPNRGFVAQPLPDDLAVASVFQIHRSDYLAPRSSINRCNLARISHTCQGLRFRCPGLSQEWRGHCQALPTRRRQRREEAKPPVGRQKTSAVSSRTAWRGS